MPSSHTNFSFANLRAIAGDLHSGREAPAELCARYLLLHLHHRHPSAWLSGPRKSGSILGGEGLLAELEALDVSLTPKQHHRLRALAGVSELFRQFYFRGVVLDSHEGMVGWLERRYPLILRLDIPTPDEMLAVQCEGKRFVSLMLDADAQFVSHGRHRDACAFLLHDFEHAHKFLGSGPAFIGQLRFFRNLRATLSEFSRWQDDALFGKDLNYLKADMNSHPVHLIKYLKAVVLSAEMRRSGLRHPPLDEFWSGVFEAWGMHGKTRAAALRINQPESETAEDLVTIADFFMPSAGEMACEPAMMEAR